MIGEIPTVSVLNPNNALSGHETAKIIPKVFDILFHNAQEEVYHNIF